MVVLTYAYRCPECQGVFDLTVGSRDEYLEARPVCPSGCKASPRRHNPAPYAPSLTDGKARMDAKYPYTSSVLPRFMKGCRHTRDGKPIIESKAHERNVMAGGGNGERWDRE